MHDLGRSAVANLPRAGKPEKIAQVFTGLKTRSVFNIAKRWQIRTALSAGPEGANCSEGCNSGLGNCDNYIPLSFKLAPRLRNPRLPTPNWWPYYCSLLGRPVRARPSEHLSGVERLSARSDI